MGDGVRTDAGEQIAAHIESVGPMPFERFMELALYGPYGFYTGAAAGSAGRRGDFITSPEVGPLFGAVLARWLDGVWRRLGAPDDFVVVDAGAGPGTLARSIVAAGPECLSSMRYVAVELADAQRGRHPTEIGPVRVESRAVVPEAPFTGVVVANELLDNLPFRLVVFDDGWREAFVDVGNDGRFIEVLSAPLEPRPAMLPPSAPIGARVPLVERAAAFITTSRRLADSVLVFDYGVARTAVLAARKWREWLRTFRNNERGDHYLTAPGTQDITADVPFDQLPEPAAVRSQTQFLQLHGIDELVAEGRRVWAEQSARPGLDAMKMRSRVSEAEALLDPHGLGGFLAAEWHRSDDLPSQG